jgi:plasmid stability protein
VEVLWSGGTVSRLDDVGAGERIAFPEIPCDPSLGGGEYRSCMAGALEVRRDRGLLSRSLAPCALESSDFHHGLIACYRSPVAQLLVRNLDDEVKEKLERRAARHGRSTAEEVREILSNAVRREDGAKAPLGSRLAARFQGIGLDEDIPELQGQPPRPAAFGR